MFTKKQYTAKYAIDIIPEVHQTERLFGLG